MLQVLLLFSVEQVRENGLHDKRLAIGSNKLQNGKTSKTMPADILKPVAFRHTMCMSAVTLSCLHLKICRASAISRNTTPAVSPHFDRGQYSP